MPFFNVRVSRSPVLPDRVHAEASYIWYDQSGHRERLMASVDLEQPKGNADELLARALTALAAALGDPKFGPTDEL